MPRINILVVNPRLGLKASKVAQLISGAGAEGKPVVLEAIDVNAAIRLVTVDSAVLVAEQVSDTEAVIRIELIKTSTESV